MSYSSTSTSFSHNNGMEGEIVGLRPTGCVFNLPIKKIEDAIIKFWVYGPFSLTAALSS